MTLDALKNNIQQERRIIKDISLLTDQLEIAYFKNTGDKNIIDMTITSLVSQLRILNKSDLVLLEGIGLMKEEPKRKLVNVDYLIGEGKEAAVIDEASRKEFLTHLNVSAQALKRLKKKYKVRVKEVVDFKKPSKLAKISNQVFGEIGNTLANNPNFRHLGENLKKANMPFLLNTYISIIFLSTLIALVISIFLWIFFMFFELTLLLPFLALSDENPFFRLLKNSWILLAIPGATYLAFYFYPWTERTSLEKRINQELPFVVIHMSAVAGSGIEPSQIFKIIALSAEYPYTRQEIKKVINQVNVYGYDLVNALKNSARLTASKKLAELFNGFSTSITTGTSLNEFLDKRAETLLFEYRLERERYTKTAETFMDIYISIVISAPMIMMILLVLIKVSGASFGLTLGGLTALMILIIGLVNVLFLVFLHLKQPNF